MQTIGQAAARLRDGTTTPSELLETCLARIDRLEPDLKAWVFVDHEGARAEARRCAAERASGLDRGPLHGIPIAIKDIIDVALWPTAAGFAPWERSIARQDAPVVRRLRQAGAVLVGKTVTTQFACFDPPPTRNPWALDRTPGGSSSGSAVAVASGMVFAALGSQTGGSIIRPASFCGVCGLKPSFGAVSTQGVVPLAESMDHIGPIARCVADLALVHEAIADRPLAPEGRAGGAAPRLGRLGGLFHDRASPEMRRLIDAVTDTLQQAGATVVAQSLPASFGEALAAHRTVIAVEAAHFHEPWLRRLGDHYRPCIRSLVEEGLAMPAVRYAAAKAHQQELRTGLMDWFAGVDAWLTPATTTPAPGAETTGDPAFNAPWSYVGWPTVSVPCGRAADGLPVSLQLIARPGDEALLFTVAAWCEARISAIGAPPSVTEGV